MKPKNVPLLCFFFCISAPLLSAQNLVFNPGFETHQPIDCVDCGVGLSDLTLMKGWKNSGYYVQLHSTDYKYNGSETDWGYSAEKFAPFKGKAVVCLPFYCGRSSRKPEGEAGYLYRNLNAPLEKDSIYAVSFWVQIRNNFNQKDHARFPFLKNFAISFSDKDFQLAGVHWPLLINDSPFKMQDLAIGEWMEVKHYIRPTRRLDRLIIGWMQDPYHLENLSEKKFNFRFEYLLDELSVIKVPEPDETIVQQAIDYPFLQRPAPPRLPDPEVVLADHTVHFDFTSHALSLSEQQALDSVAAQILKIREGVFEIIGHTDDIGSNNEVLSLQRAETVKSYLVKKTGFSDYHFRISGKGSLKAVSDNQTEKGRALNRRVEVKQSELTLSMVFYEKASRAALNGQPDTAFYYLRRWQARPNVDQILLLYDPDLVSLRAHKAWEAVAYFVKQSYDKYNKNKEFAWQLANLYCKDQYYRGLGSDYELAKGYTPKELDTEYYDSMKKMEEEQKKSNNHIEIISDLIQQYGWPDLDTLGKRLSLVPVYVIIHSDNLTIQKHWLPSVEKAFRDNKVEAYWFAHVFDAVMKKEKGVQRYGTAYFANPEDRLEYSIGPLEDEANVDSLRAEIGMPPLKLREFRIVEKPDEDN